VLAADSAGVMRCIGLERMKEGKFGWLPHLALGPGSRAGMNAVPKPETCSPRLPGMTALIAPLGCHPGNRTAAAQRSAQGDNSVRLSGT